MSVIGFEWNQANDIVNHIKGIQNKTLILNGNSYMKYNKDTKKWLTVSQSTPTVAQFISDGMDSISPLLNRKVTDLNPIPMVDKSDILLENESGKVYSGTFNAFKYFDVKMVKNSDSVGKMLIYDSVTDKYYKESNEEFLEVTNLELSNILIEGNSTLSISDVFYDTFKNNFEILYYTSETSISSVSLMLEVNWSPIDELEGDFEVLTWTDEEDSKAQLKLLAVPTPKLVYSLDVNDVTGNLNSVLTNDTSTYYYKSNVKYILSPDNVDWYTFKNGDFNKLNNINNDTIESEGMSYAEFSILNSLNFTNWRFEKVNIGVYLSDNTRDTVISKVSNIGFKEGLSTSTSAISDASFYILNTTATIDLDFNGLTLTGSLSDEDSTKVQYRIRLNGDNYLPSDGSFTALYAPPKNIDITLSSNEINIGDWNTLEVDFKDYFGTVDTWSINFLGDYASLMFTDEKGEFYSSDIGEILKYLDFGQILTGQTTPSYMVNIKNQYGYDVTDVSLSADTTEFPQGLAVNFSMNDDFSVARNYIEIGDLSVNEQKPFYIRMTSPINTEPNGSNTFDIYVSAKREV